MDKTQEHYKRLELTLEALEAAHEEATHLFGRVLTETPPPTTAFTAYLLSEKAFLDTLISHATEIYIETHLSDDEDEYRGEELAYSQARQRIINQLIELIRSFA